MIANGLELLGSTSKELEEFLVREIAKWTKVAKAGGISAN